MSEVRASELDKGMTYREIGEDAAVTIADIGWHGDTVLITTTDDEEFTLDRDTVVERLPKLPDMEMDVVGKTYGGAYWSDADYRIILTVLGTREDFALMVEDSVGVISTTMLNLDEVDGITKMASVDHGLNGYEDDWNIPTGIDRRLTWNLPVPPNHEVVLDEDQIDEIAQWLRYATGEEVWEGGETWEER